MLMKENFTYIDNEWIGRELGIKNPLEREVFSHIYGLTIKGDGGWRGSVRELAERLFYPKSTIAKAINNLINNNLIVKVENIYKSVPVRPQDVQIRDIYQNEQNLPVQQLDNNVPDVDVTVPNQDFLPPTPPINNNIKELKEYNNTLSLFEDFWNIFKVNPDHQYERASCIKHWKEMDPVNQRLVIDQLTECNDKDSESPYRYLKDFRPRGPFFLMRDEIQGYLQDGKDLVIVKAADTCYETPTHKCVTLKEQRIFNFPIVRILKAKDYFPDVA